VYLNSIITPVLTNRVATSHPPGPSVVNQISKSRLKTVTQSKGSKYTCETPPSDPFPPTLACRSWFTQLLVYRRSASWSVCNRSNTSYGLEIRRVTDAANRILDRNFDNTKRPDTVTKPGPHWFLVLVARGQLGGSEQAKIRLCDHRFINWFCSYRWDPHSDSEDVLYLVDCARHKPVASYVRALIQPDDKMTPVNVLHFYCSSHLLRTAMMDSSLETVPGCKFLDDIVQGASKSTELIEPWRNGRYVYPFSIAGRVCISCSS
jgi:hypothetical protein